MVKIMRPAAATPPKKVKQSLQTTINKGPTRQYVEMDAFEAATAQASLDFDKVCKILGGLRAATQERRLLEKEVAEFEGQTASKREQLMLARDEVIAMSQALFPELYDMRLCPGGVETKLAIAIIAIIAAPLLNHS